MKTANLRTATIATLLLLVSKSGMEAAQARRGDDPPFESFSVVQYVTADGPTPQNVLLLDNNGEIALAARGGVGEEALSEVVPFTESQIELLKTYRLLEDSDGTLKTTFPILGPDQTRRLRARSQAAASRLAERLGPDVRKLVDELRAIGRGENAYTILFSYVLDGLVWDEFEQHSLVDVRETTAESPHWSGEVWALYPARAFSSGTNVIAEGGISLIVNWTEAAIPHMAPFVADFPTLIQMFDDFRSAGVVEHERVREVFGPFDLFDEAGRFTIPILDEYVSNPLYRSARVIARDAAAHAPTLLGSRALVEEFAFRDEKQALVVAYHELMWDVMDRFEAEDLVRKPVAFAETDRTEPSDIADLVFIVRGSKRDF